MCSVQMMHLLTELERRAFLREEVRGKFRGLNGAVVVVVELEN